MNQKGNVCSICSQTFHNLFKLREHERSHSGERPFICDCGKAYVRKQHLTRHQLQCLPTTLAPMDQKLEERTVVKSYFCSQCSAGPFTKKKFVWAHMAIVHRLANHLCDHCNRAFTTLSKLRRHASKHHGYICPRCSTASLDTASEPVRFGTFVALRKHIASVHPKPKLQCPTCGQRFNRPSLLTAHEAIHTPGSLQLRKTFVCSLCTSLSSGSSPSQVVAFTAKRNLAAHMRMAHGNLTFPCTWDGCPVLLSTKQKLEQHLVRHEMGKPVGFKTRPRRKRAQRSAALSNEHVSPNNDWETESQSSIVALLNGSELEDQYLTDTT